MNGPYNHVCATLNRQAATSLTSGQVRSCVYQTGWLAPRTDGPIRGCGAPDRCLPGPWRRLDAASGRRGPAAQSGGTSPVRGQGPWGGYRREYLQNRGNATRSLELCAETPETQGRQGIGLMMMSPP